MRCSMSPFAGLLFAALLASPVWAASLAPEVKQLDWPAGEGGVIAQTKCLICHGPEMIQSQRLTAGQWEKEVKKMTGWGAPLSPAEQKTLAAYLAGHFAVDAPAFKPQRARLLP